MGRALDVTITYLRQTARPLYTPPPRPNRKLAIIRAENPPVHFYRYIYDLIGARWHWVSRKKLSDAELEEIIRRPDVFLYILHVDGVPAGMAEIDAGGLPQIVDIRFFGLAPDFIGQGLSRFFLANAVDLAWSHNPLEVRIETCTLDHPAALALYQKFGFDVFDQKKGRVEIDDASDGVK